jgi:DNA-binding Xre family transcriptional regulator
LAVNLPSKNSKKTIILAKKIMLQLDVLKVCNNKGIDNPKRFLVHHGFSHSAAFRLVNNQQDSVSMSVLQKLCTILYCTPNDLMSWHATETNTLPANHPLTILKPIAKQASISSQLKTMAPDKILEVQAFIDSLTKKEG